MKILFPSIFYLPKRSGGIEQYIHHLAKGLQQKGHEVKVAVPVYADEDWRKDDYVYDDLQIVRYNSYSSEGKLEMSGVKPNGSLESFRQLLELERPDIVHFSQLTNSSGIGLQHLEAAKSAGCKIVYTNHMSEFICQRGDLQYMGTAVCDGKVTVQKCTTCLMHTRQLNKAAAYTLAAADRVAAKLVGEKKFLRQLKPVTFPGFYTRWHIHKIQSIVTLSNAFVSIAAWSTALMKHNGWYNNKCHTIPTGLLRKYTATSGSLPVYDGKRPLRIVYVGRIFPVKAPDVLLQAVRGINGNLVEVNIYGQVETGNEKEYYDNCVALTAGFANLKIHPPVNNREVVDVMRQHDVLCLPSKGNEMAPLVIQEALAAGIPVIGSALPAIEETVKDGINGFTFRVGDSTMLQQKIMELVRQPQLVQSLKKNLPAPGSFDDVVNAYDELYQSLFSVINS